MRRQHRLVALACAVLALAVGCLAGRAHRPLYNEPASGPPDRAAATREHPTDAMVWVAFSGGGTRAAAVAWKTLEVLRGVPFTYERDGETVRSDLASEIDYISGISGGSFAAAAWPLFRDDPDLFRARFLRRDLQRRLAVELLWPPWRAFRLASPEYDRINCAAELYDREIFDGATFADLPARPELRIHATNVALGERFTFAEPDFRRIGSDLSSYPLGYACAASSAFPVLLSPMTLRNYGDTLPLDELKATDRRYRRLLRQARTDVLSDLRRLALEHYNDKSNGWVHLADGGIVDNQGLEAILAELQGTGVIGRRLSDSSRPLRRLILINVNAGVRADGGAAKVPRSPGIEEVVEHTMVASMDILSAKRWVRIQDYLKELYRPVLAGHEIPSLGRLERPYAIEIAFRNVQDPEVRARCNALPTSFALDDSQLELIDEVVPRLIAEDPDMIRLRESLAADS